MLNVAERLHVLLAPQVKSPCKAAMAGPLVSWKAGAEY